VCRRDNTEGANEKQRGKSFAVNLGWRSGGRSRRFDVSRGRLGHFQGVPVAGVVPRTWSVPRLRGPRAPTMESSCTADSQSWDPRTRQAEMSWGRGCVVAGRVPSVFRVSFDRPCLQRSEGRIVVAVCSEAGRQSMRSTAGWCPCVSVVGVIGLREYPQHRIRRTRYMSKS
jgi:hypothetical protein